jgi:hypothetical protein
MGMLVNRASKILGFGLAALAGAIAVRCGSSDNPSTSGGGGSTGTGGGTGTGGTTGTGGRSGSGGTTVADSAVGGGVSDAGGDSGLPANCTALPVLDCTPILPPQGAFITDFSLPEGGVTTRCDGTVGPTAFGLYGDLLTGGPYIYPAACPDECNPTAALTTFPLLEDLSAGNWHITGSVGTYSGFGLYVNHRTGPQDPVLYTYPYTGIPYHAINASAFSGVTFTISGNPGPGGNVVLGMSSVATTVSMTTRTNAAGTATFTTCGTCAVAPCGNIDVTVPVTATPTPVTVTWAQAGITDPGALMSVSWRFVYVAGAPAYPVDVTLDDISFAPP